MPDASSDRSSISQLSAEYRLVCYVCHHFSASASSPHPSTSSSLFLVLSEETGAVDRTSRWTREHKCFLRSSVSHYRRSGASKLRSRSEMHILYMHHALIQASRAHDEHTFILASRAQDIRTGCAWSTSIIAARFWTLRSPYIERCNARSALFCVRVGGSTSRTVASKRGVFPERFGELSSIVRSASKRHDQQATNDIQLLY